MINVALDITMKYYFFINYFRSQRVKRESRIEKAQGEFERLQMDLTIHVGIIIYIFTFFFAKLLV